MESHQASKLDVSGTAKAVISCFQELGASFDLDQVSSYRSQINFFFHNSMNQMCLEKYTISPKDKSPWAGNQSNFKLN